MAFSENGLPVSGSVQHLSFATRSCLSVGGLTFPLSLLGFAKE